MLTLRDYLIQLQYDALGWPDSIQRVQTTCTPTFIYRNTVIGWVSGVWLMA